jgi:hypothetical protein
MVGVRSQESGGRKKKEERRNEEGSIVGCGSASSPTTSDITNLFIDRIYAV